MITISLTIDGKTIQVLSNATILDAAQQAGIYVPTLCSHPDLPSDGRCGLCTVEVGEEAVLACETRVENGMQVKTATDLVKSIRRDKLSAILLHHPHACLTCAQKVGCSRTQCSSNVDVKERCCQLLGNCEIERLVDYVGLREDLGRYVYRDLPKFSEEPLFSRDYNLCIGCGRCVRACKELNGADALELYSDQGTVVARAKQGSLAESGCRFCTACVEVCPTGALMDKDYLGGDRDNMLLPCANRCPAKIEVPRYVGYIAKEEYSMALAVIREKVPFPGVLGRVCFHPCEEVCRRGKVNEPVAICRLKRYAADFGGAGWKVKRKCAPASGKKVAIIGSGPAGLTAANDLALKGHSVTVFEALPIAGGMLRVGIPDYRLPPSVLDAEVAEIQALGVEIRTDARVESFEQLFSDGYAAVLVATGAHKGSEMGVPGEEIAGVLSGVSFLREVNLYERREIGKRVAVVGGGNVAIDAARTALRLGADEVTVLYRRTQEEMPANGEEVTEALFEGIKFEFLTAPVKISAKKCIEGYSLDVLCRRMELGEPDAGGRRRPVTIDGSDFSLEFDNLIAAIGQKPEVPAGFGLNLRGEKIQVANDTLGTNKPGVFAAGDAVLGPASVIEAIAGGRKAAAAMDRYLGGDGDISEVLLERELPGGRLVTGEGFAAARRAGSSKRPWQKSTQTKCGGCPSDELVNMAFSEVELPLSEDMAVQEADRCLRCHLRLQIRPVVKPPEVWRIFDAESVATVPETEGVFQLLDAGKNVTHIIGTAKIRESMQEYLDNEDVCYFDYEEEPMYTQRESQLIQQYLQQHGKLPKGNDELDDLF